MLADAGTDVVVADAHQSDAVADAIRQTVYAHALRHLAEFHHLKGDRQVFGYQPLHLTLYLLLFLTCGLVVYMKAHLALLTLDMGIIRAFAAKQAYHHLVQQMLGRMSRRKLLLVMLIKLIVLHHSQLRFKFPNPATAGTNHHAYTTILAEYHALLLLAEQISSRRCCLLQLQVFKGVSGQTDVDVDVLVF